MKVFVITCLWLLSTTMILASELPEACTVDCNHPYGGVLGDSYSDVRAYSNCNSSCVVPEPHTVNGTFTGIKWQCVEYARRWLLVNLGMVYGEVDYAIDIWDSIEFYTRISDDKKIPVASRLNGSSVPPRRGSLLIYAKSLFGTGHVAVVIRTDPQAGKIEIAEQNFNNQPWPDKYSRRLDLVHRDGRYWILDPYLIGWKQIADNNES